MVLLIQLGLDVGDLCFIVFDGGGNNCVYVVDMVGGCYLVKVYFSDVVDICDCLGVEY